MATAVAIVSVAASAIVAITVPFINARLERQRLRYQVTQERFAELRTLLDQAAERLTEARTVLVEVAAPSAVTGRGQERAQKRLTDLAVEVFRDNTRLALRLGGGHSLYQAHAEAMSALHQVEGLRRTQRQQPTLTDLKAFDRGLQKFMRGLSRCAQRACPADHPGNARQYGLDSRGSRTFCHQKRQSGIIAAL